MQQRGGIQSGRVSKWSILAQRMSIWEHSFTLLYLYFCVYLYMYLQQMANSCARHVHPRTFIHACVDADDMEWIAHDVYWHLEVRLKNTLFQILFRNSIVLHRLHLHSVPFHPFLSTNLRELAVAAVAVVVTAAVAVAVVLNSSLFTENSGTLITCLSNSVNRNRQNAVWKTWKGGDSFLFAPIHFFWQSIMGRVVYSFCQYASSHLQRERSAGSKYFWIDSYHVCKTSPKKCDTAHARNAFWPKEAKT